MRKIGFATLLLVVAVSPAAFSRDATHLDTPATVSPAPVGRGGNVARASVYRIICTQTNLSGTGFLHKSGDILTAYHVVKGCDRPEIIRSDGGYSLTVVLAKDEDKDLAILIPDVPLSGNALSISSGNNLTIGTQVTTWGYPGGYFGASPLLGVGYLAGVDSFQNDDKSIVTRWVVNAAFNHGNSGGPLIDESSGEVIGVVISKLAPLSENTKQIISLLSKEQTGVVFNFKQKDGKTASVSEASLVESVLSDLSSQVQLVVGYAALTADLTGFLKKNGLDP